MNTRSIFLNECDRITKEINELDVNERYIIRKGVYDCKVIVDKRVKNFDKYIAKFKDSLYTLMSLYIRDRYNHRILLYSPSIENSVKFKLFIAQYAERKVKRKIAFNALKQGIEYEKAKRMSELLRVKDLWYEIDLIKEDLIKGLSKYFDNDVELTKTYIEQVIKDSKTCYSRSKISYSDFVNILNNIYLDMYDFKDQYDIHKYVNIYGNTRRLTNYQEGKKLLVLDMRQFMFVFSYSHIYNVFMYLNEWDLENTITENQNLETEIRTSRSLW